MGNYFSGMKVAIVGLGIIGEAWADNLAADGLPLATWNRSPKQRPDFVPDLLQAVGDATHIFIVVADAPAVAELVAKIVPVLHAGQTVLQSSTITPDAVRAAAAAVAPTGALFLDAPFTGSKPAAQQRQTVYYLGGEAAAIEAARPVLERLSKTILHIGGIGAGSALKLAMNLNIAQVAQSLSESLTLARASGISDELYFQALKANVSNSGITALKETKLRTNDFSPQFSLKHMFKDLRQAQELAGQKGTKLPQLETVLKVYAEGAAKGWGDQDFTTLIQLLAKDE